MITASQVPVGQFFPNNYFTIPGFQRPYVWGKDEIETLLEDLENAQKAQLQDYFIGNVVFYTAFMNNFNVSIILDGQQRLTTIFLLFAVIRDKLNLPQIQTLLEFNSAGIQRDKIEFDIRPDVTAFIKLNILPHNGTIAPVSITYSDKSAIQMSKAIGIMHNWFNANPIVNIATLYQYILNNVFIVSVASGTMGDALRLFTVLNNRGVKLRASDILKADNLAVIPQFQQNQFAKDWESVENDFDEEEFDNFLLHLRTIIIKSKAQKNLLDEFKDIYKSGKLQLGQPTFEYIKKYKQHHDDLYDIGYMGNDLRLYNIVQILTRTSKSNIWIPVLLSYKEKFGSLFLTDFAIILEKKFSADWLNGVSLTPRITAMNEILKAIDNYNTPQLLLADKSLLYSRNFLNALRTNDLYGASFAQYVLAKLCFILGTPQTVPLQFKGTIEHILPQNPNPASQWVKDFTLQQMNDWKHKLGNLILLDRKKNTTLSNYDYTIKYSKYFNNHINLYPLSVHIMGKYTSTWAINELIQNHDNMINLLDKNY